VPTEMVHALLSGKVQSQSMWTHRLTPISRTGKATPEGLEEVAREVLKPHFHEEGQEVVKVRLPSLPACSSVLENCGGRYLPDLLAY
jgi:hypothetical protein